MTKFFANIGLQLAFVALALLLTSWFVTDVVVSGRGFITAVVVFAIAQAVFLPIATWLAKKYASAILGGIGLISTVVALWVSTLISGGLAIHGAGAWVLATIVVWIVTAIGTGITGTFLLPKLERHRQDRKK